MKIRAIDQNAGQGFDRFFARNGLKTGNKINFLILLLMLVVSCAEVTDSDSSSTVAAGTNPPEHGDDIEGANQNSTDSAGAGQNDNSQDNSVHSSQNQSGQNQDGESQGSDTSAILKSLEDIVGVPDGNGDSRKPVISRDGSKVVFESDASNLLPGDTNNSLDIFVVDIPSGSIRRVSVDSEGNESNGNSADAEISGDGNFVVFKSAASNLVEADTNDTQDVFLHSLITGETRRVSVSEQNGEANHESSNPSISGDGRYIAFESQANNLVAGDENYSADIFLFDSLNNSLRRVSQNSVGSSGDNNTQNLSSSNPMISEDGRFIVFDSYAPNLVENDTNAFADIFLYDLEAETVSRLSSGLAGEEANGESLSAGISADGRYVVFSSGASNLVEMDDNATNDIFRLDRTTGEIGLVSSNGTQIANDVSLNPMIDQSGHFVVFESFASNLVLDDNNNVSDVFIKNLLDDKVIMVSRFNELPGDNHSGYPDVSGSGTAVVFHSRASNFSATPSSYASDIWLKQFSFSQSN